MHKEISYCVFDYLYRDGSNYKAWGSLLLSGESTHEDVTALKECLESGEYFVAEQVGIPPVYKELWDLSGGPTDEIMRYTNLLRFECQLTTSENRCRYLRSYRICS